MARVTGIGGIFFKAGNPRRTGEWYRSHLGIDAQGEDENSALYTAYEWREKDGDRSGSTVWGIFPKETGYFGSESQSFMVNYRVDDLRALLTQLRQEGVWVDERIEEYEYGIFGWIKDPEGNRIELWQPLGPE